MNQSIRLYYTETSGLDPAEFLPLMSAARRAALGRCRHPGAAGGAHQGEELRRIKAARFGIVKPDGLVHRLTSVC